MQPPCGTGVRDRSLPLPSAVRSHPSPDRQAGLAGDALFPTLSSTLCTGWFRVLLQKHNDSEITEKTRKQIVLFCCWKPSPVPSASTASSRTGHPYNGGPKQQLGSKVMTDFPVTAVVLGELPLLQFSSNEHPAKDLTLQAANRKQSGGGESGCTLPAKGLWLH